MMSFTETSQLLQKELMNDYSYRVPRVERPQHLTRSIYDIPSTARCCVWDVVE